MRSRAPGEGALLWTMRRRGRADRSKDGFSARSGAEWRRPVRMASRRPRSARRARLELRAVGRARPRARTRAKRAAVEASLARRGGRIFFNVHGTDQDAVWLGEGGGRYPEVLRSPAANAAESAIVVSEACYGASLFGGFGPPIAGRFLANGAGAF